MIVDEAERSLHDALCVLTQTVKETRTVFGGGLGNVCFVLVIWGPVTLDYFHLAIAAMNRFVLAAQNHCTLAALVFRTFC